ncbi:molecular chaperone DnaJ [Halovenus aranensis]|jgi:molecular chaperone DnaJ|uniref:Chaperone protein DnaJ n=1 Tax=Halovenus aranensis TaxID=890420 RepID=A0A1G8U3P6_9EURY|nr:molecular chaperone DnaJ [Halovenus aranensis]SDJ48353.1 molecular chaperone DnaJ [Halovenus aranensis]
MSEDFYDILGVSRDASEDEIEEAYREAVRKYHPDVSDDPDAEEKFKKAKKAKEVLTDEEKRRQYDQMGHERFSEAEKRGGVGGGSRQGGDPFGGGGGFNDVQDIFDQFFGGGGGGRSRNRPQSGQDLKTTLEIDLETAYHGADKELTVNRPEACDECDGRGHPPGTDSRACPRCDGQGQVTQVQQTAFGRMQQRSTCRRCGGEGTLYEETCSTCRGDGVVRNEASLQVEIPPGIRDGQTLRMDGEGAPGDRGARNGDLLVEISVTDHPDFERNGDDLKTRQPISFPQAVFGDTIEVETLDGPVEFDLEAGTQSGETFRLKGKGMPRLRRRGQGDLYVQVQVVTPDSLNEEQREALEEFAEAGGEDVEVDRGFFDRLKNSF